MTETISIDIVLCFSNNTWEVKSTVWVDVPIVILELTSNDGLIEWAIKEKLFPFTNGEPEKLVYAFVAGYTVED